MNSLVNKHQSYSGLAKWLHWGMAIMVISLISIGTFMTGLESDDPMRRDFYGMHKSFGVIFMQLAIVRILWSRYRRPPKLPDALKKWEKSLTKTVTFLLYLLMLAIPFSGYAMSNFAGAPVTLFGLIDFPQIFAKDLVMMKLAKLAHVTFIYSLVVITVGHVGGVIKHRFFDKEDVDVLPRMLARKK